MRMHLRKELLPTERTDEFKAMLKLRIQLIEQKLANGEDATNEIKEFNAITGREYKLDYFQDYWTFMSIDEFVKEVSSPVPKKIADITKEELMEVVRRIKDVETYKEDTEFYLQLFEANVIMPEVSDLIFWDELTPEEVVEKALSYKPISL